MTWNLRAGHRVHGDIVTPRHLHVFYVVLVLALVTAGCAQGGADSTTTTTTSPSGTAASTTTTSPGEAPDPVAEAIERAVWQYLGVVIPSEPFVAPGGNAHLADLKVGRLGDGTYIGIAHRAEQAGGGQAVFTSTDLLDWQFAGDISIDNQGFHGGFITLEDGSLRMFWVEFQALPTGDLYAVASATSIDGLTWERDPDLRLTQHDFDRDVLLEHVSIVPVAGGGWRMYVSVIDCTIESLHGNPNCDIGEQDPALGGVLADAHLFSIYSAVSSDTLNWALEPGARFQGSWENGSFSHQHAWIGDDGRVRISSQMDPPPALGESEWRIAFGTIVSEDGLDFHGYVEQSITLGDPFVVRSDDGVLLAFSSPGTTRPGSGIRVWQLTTVTWEFDQPLRTPLPGQGAEISATGDQGRHGAACFRIDVRGEGRFTLDVRGGHRHDEPSSAAPDLYDLSHDVIDAPATFYIVTREHRAPDLPDVEMHEVASQVVATDENGVQWWLPLHSVGVEPPGDSCGP